MGVMIEGMWHVDEPASGSVDDGNYRRNVSTFRNWITPDGAPGVDGGAGGFAAEPGRYHLYVATGCPWAHRTMIVRILKGLEKIVSLDVVLPKLARKAGCSPPLPDRTAIRSIAATRCTKYTAPPMRAFPDV